MGHWFRFRGGEDRWVFGLGLGEGWVGLRSRFRGGVGGSLI